MRMQILHLNVFLQQQRGAFSWSSRHVGISSTKSCTWHATLHQTMLTVLWSKSGAECFPNHSRLADLIKSLQLLLVVGDIKVDVRIWASEFECGQIICKGCLFLFVKAAKIDLLPFLPDVGLPTLSPARDDAQPTVDLARN